MPARRKPARLARLVPGAEYAQVSVKTLRRRFLDGTLTPYRIGPKILAVDLDEIDRKLIRPVATGAAMRPPDKRIGPDPHPGRNQPPQTTTANLQAGSVIRPGCAVCRGPLPARRRRFCSDDHRRKGQRAERVTETGEFGRRHRAVRDLSVVETTTPQRPESGVPA